MIALRVSRPPLFRFAVAAVAVAACAEPPPARTGGPLYHFDEQPGNGTLTICKVGTVASFNVFEDGVLTQTVTLAPGECRLVVDALPHGVIGSATEIIPSGVTLDSIVVSELLGDGPPIVTTLPAGSTTVRDTVFRSTIVATFYNHISSVLGRMTGGGGQVRIDDVRITRGFTIHCDITLSNNVEVNWPGNKWHIDKPLTSATCIDDPNIHPEPPPAPFDTFIGEGDGDLNGVPGSHIRFTFIDAGEPGGKNDKAQIEIWDANGNLVLNVPMSFLTNGNIQAHFDQPHK